ncbi:ATP-binding cassette domain-containing protein [Corynebacterium sputi]|uniref:ATP-binding cassette domain-containing protein n=1 Tax=Corynebacterium sputi TaxID=489915 RepID=UPI0004086FD2|nr:ATP-binding cassette domain-containing protein [Corynebacterium sputi]
MGWCADIAVEVEDLRINHGKCPLVRVSHLQIRFGERVAVIGRSGAGKSLLAGALTGTVPAAVSVTGKITLAGHIRGGEAVTGISGALFGTVAFARQDSADALNPLVSITDQLAIPLRRRGLRGPDAHDAAHRLLAGLGLEEPSRILSSHPGELSGGQRQRVCIALALACEPEMLIMDECTTALDVVSQSNVVEKLRSLETLVFITHDLPVAADLCDRVIVMDTGHVVEDAPVEQIFTAPEHPLTRHLVGELVEAAESARVVAA